MNFKLPKEIKAIAKKIQDSGCKTYLVGGAVRDLLMDREVKDWDLTTDAKPDKLQKIFTDSFYDNKFGTVGIPADLGIVEITTMRKEGDYKDHRHPLEVGWTDNVEEDLARRDFTVNAMALSVVPSVSEKSADLSSAIDPFKGQKDLQKKLIRAVGDPDKRFREDALRLMRATRIATELEFEIEKNTFNAIKKNAALVKEVAWERIRDELFKILTTPKPYDGILKMREAGILQIILPELERCFGIMQEGPKHDRTYDIGEHCLLTLKYCPSHDPLVRLSSLLHDIGKPDTIGMREGNVTFYNHEVAGSRLILDIAKRFNLSKKQTDKIRQLVRWHMFSVSEHQTDSAIRRFIKNVGIENIDDMMDLRIGDRLGGGTVTAVSWRMTKFRERINQVLQKPFTLSDLKINGSDVMNILNLKPGPKVGEILQRLFSEVLEDSEKNNREYLLKKVKSLG